MRMMDGARGWVHVCPSGGGHREELWVTCNVGGRIAARDTRRHEETRGDSAGHEETRGLQRGRDASQPKPRSARLAAPPLAAALSCPRPRCCLPGPTLTVLVPSYSPYRRPPRRRRHQNRRAACANALSLHSIRVRLPDTSRLPITHLLRPLPRASQPLVLASVMHELVQHLRSSADVSTRPPRAQTHSDLRTGPKTPSARSLDSAARGTPRSSSDMCFANAVGQCADAPAIHGAFTTRYWTSRDAARMDSVYVVFPDMEYTKSMGESPSHRVLRFLTVRVMSPGPRPQCPHRAAN